MRTVRSTLVLLALGGLAAAAGESVGLTDRPGDYYETAVAVFYEGPEVVEKDGRKYRVLLQDVITEEVRPKVRRGHASGFFLYHGDDYYFVTARHVAERLDPGSRVGFVNSGGESRQFVLAKLVGAEDRFVWRHHEQTDVSLMKLSLPEIGVAEVADIAIAARDLHLQAPPRTARMVVAGFPGGLGTRGGKISPITAVVHLASEEIHLGAMLEGIRVNSAYLVNPPAGKGYSGGPIFYTDPDGRVRCAGMLNGAWSDPTGGKFSISVPAKYILELVDE